MRYLKGLLLIAVIMVGISSQTAAYAYEARMYGMTGLLGRAFGFSIGVDTAMEVPHRQDVCVSPP